MNAMILFYVSVKALKSNLFDPRAISNLYILLPSQEYLLTLSNFVKEYFAKRLFSNV